jgi:hypothetical protein
MLQILVLASCFFLFLAVLGLELRSYILSHSLHQPIFVKGSFEIDSHELGWLRASVLLISAS